MVRRIVEKKIDNAVIKLDDSEICIACGDYVPDGGLLCYTCLSKSGEGVKN